MYVALIQNINSGRYDSLRIFSPLSPGDIIGWGADANDPEGIARWVVRACVLEN